MVCQGMSGCRVRWFAYAGRDMAGCYCKCTRNAVGRLTSRSNRAAVTTRTTRAPIFVLFDASIIFVLLLYYPLNYVLQKCLLFCYVWWLCLAISTSVQHNGGLLPDIILLTQGQRVPRTVFFPWRIVQSI